MCFSNRYCKNTIVRVNILLEPVLCCLLCSETTHFRKKQASNIGRNDVTDKYYCLRDRGECYFGGYSRGWDEV